MSVATRMIKLITNDHYLALIYLLDHGRLYCFCNATRRRVHMPLIQWNEKFVILQVILKRFHSMNSNL